MGCPAFSFIDQGEAGIIDERKKKNQRQRRSFEGAGSSFFSERALLTADGAMDSSMLGVYPLMMPCSGLINKWSRPIPPRRAARRTRVLIHDPTGSGRRSDRTSITIEDVSLLLDRSGCRILPSGYVPEGKCRRLQYCLGSDMSGRD